MQINNNIGLFVVGKSTHKGTSISFKSHVIAHGMLPFQLHFYGHEIFAFYNS
jgi:hypothetical protein